MNCNINLTSSFLHRNTFPNGTPYPYGTNNYVTGGSNYLENIYALHNHHMRGEFGGTACQNYPGKWTFKDFEDLFREAFNAYWYIDQNGNFRIEHASFFLPGFAHSDFEQGADLTTISARCMNNVSTRKNKYKFVVENLYDQEEWEWQHSQGTEGTITHGPDFQGLPIYYASASGGKHPCVPGEELKVLKHNIQHFWTDIYWAFQLMAAGTPDTITCDKGICISVCHQSLGIWYITCQVGLISAASVQNGHLSTANLIGNYHTWERIFNSGWINGNAGATAFDSSIPKKIQEMIEFPFCCENEFNPLDYITTDMGTGKLYSAEFFGLKNSMKIELLYD